MKKILALVIAALMIVASMAALADVPTSQTIADGNAADANGKYTISVASTDTHTYTVYQVLTGTLIAGQNKLGNPAWGADATTTAKAGSATDFINTITNLSGVTLADTVKGYVDTTTTGRGNVDKTNSMDVDPGYYLIIDTTANLADGDSYSLNIVAVFNDIVIAAKKGTTQSDKKVDDINDSNNSENNVVWEDSADYDIGDDVPYRLTATIADDYANYTKGYKLTFHDKMDDTLSFNENVEVFIGNIKLTNPESGDPYYTVTKNPTDGDTFDVHFENLKNVPGVQAGTVITVTFSAKLTAAAKIGSQGNDNTSHVTYTNNPNDNQAGENGKTPDDTVRVFTFKAIFDKYTTQDSVKKHLAGAEFTLYKVKDTITNVQVADFDASADYVVKTYTATKSEGKYDDETEAVPGSVFTFAGIDDGTYVLVETTTPTGYNKADNLKFVVIATHEADATDPQLLTFNGNKTTGVVDASMVSATTAGSAATRTAEILNNQGNILPSTGGIGTTLFYVGGGILVVLAGILLVTKRRMKAED